MKEIKMTFHKTKIDYIQSILTNFLKEFLYNNKSDSQSNRLDLEDAFCDFLNLIYGWKLKKESHKLIDSVAFYLVDYEREICVQTNFEISRKGIESSIADFYPNYGSESIKKRILIILSDKRKAQKVPHFVYSPDFDQDIEIISFRNLRERINTLDAQVVADICSCFTEKYCEKIFPHSKKLRKILFFYYVNNSI